MTAGPWIAYGPFIEACGDGGVDMDNDTFKIALIGNGYTPNTSTDDQLSDVTGDEASNYTRPTLTATWIRAGTTVTFDADNLSIQASGGDVVAQYAVIFDDTHADDIPVCYCLLDDSPAEVTVPDGAQLNLTFNASGIMTLAPA